MTYEGGDLVVSQSPVLMHKTFCDSESVPEYMHLFDLRMSVRGRLCSVQDWCDGSSSSISPAFCREKDCGDGSRGNHRWDRVKDFVVLHACRGKGPWRWWRIVLLLYACFAFVVALASFVGQARRHATCDYEPAETCGAMGSHRHHDASTAAEED